MNAYFGPACPLSSVCSMNVYLGPHVLCQRYKEQEKRKCYTLLYEDMERTA